MFQLIDYEGIKADSTVNFQRIHRSKPNPQSLWLFIRFYRFPKSWFLLPWLLPVQLPTGKHILQLVLSSLTIPQQKTTIGYFIKPWISLEIKNSLSSSQEFPFALYCSE